MARHTVLFIGRFQPVHRGHIEVLCDLLSRYDRVIVGIGSAQACHTLRDPLTAGERMEVLDAAFEEDPGIDPTHIRIVPIPDVKDNRLWMAHVRSLVPRFDTLVSSNALVRLLAERETIPVEAIALIERENLSSTSIRRMAADGDDGWRSRVPEATLPLLEAFDFVRRLQVLTYGDDTPTLAEQTL